MHIALAGPMTLALLEQELDAPVPSAGFPFPGTALLALEYLRRGHRVTAVTTGSDIAAPLRVTSGRLDVVVLPARGRGRRRAFDLFRAERREIRATLDAARPDVIHAHWTYEFGLAARAAHAPALVTVHDWAPAVARYNRHPYWYFRAVMQAWCLVRPGLLSAPSSYVAERVHRWYRRACAVVPNGIDLGEFASAPTRSAAPPVIAMLNVGFTDRKNVAAALRAWPAVRRAHPDAVLRLAGPDFGPDEPAAAWAGEHGLTAGVEFTGRIEARAVPGFLRDATAFLHTSREESFGIVLVEAMASGLPVIAGRGSGAVSSVVGDAGIPVDVGDPGAISTALIRLLGDPAARGRYGAAGARRAQRYSLDAAADAYLRLLSTLPR